MAVSHADYIAMFNKKIYVPIGTFFLSFCFYRSMIAGMESYNFLADLLNKYSQLTPWVQALVGLGLCAVILGAFYFLKETVAVLISPLQRQKPDSRIEIDSNTVKS